MRLPLHDCDPFVQGNKAWDEMDDKMATFWISNETILAYILNHEKI